MVKYCKHKSETHGKCRSELDSRRISSSAAPEVINEDNGGNKVRQIQLVLVKSTTKPECMNKSSLIYIIYSSYVQTKVMTSNPKL